MTFHTFNPSTDTLEVGTKIRLAGREGEIGDVDQSADYHHKIQWLDGEIEWLTLDRFPLLEIADKPVKPLTIDKRVKGELLEKFCGSFEFDSDDNKFRTYLNSLEET